MGHSRAGDAVLPDEAVKETGCEDELVRGRAEEGFRLVGANRSPADGARDEPPDMGVAAYEVLVAGVHEKEARGVRPGPPESGLDRLRRAAPHVLEHFHPDAAKRPGGAEEALHLLQPRSLPNR